MIMNAYLLLNSVVGNSTRMVTFGGICIGYSLYIFLNEQGFDLISLTVLAFLFSILSIQVALKLQVNYLVLWHWMQ